MAAPVSGSPSGWTWKVVERARWDGCPAPGAPVVFTVANLFVDPGELSADHEDPYVWDGGWVYVEH